MVGDLNQTMNGEIAALNVCLVWQTIGRKFYGTCLNSVPQPALLWNSGS